MGWFAVAAVGLLVLSLIPMLARDDWRAVDLERPSLKPRTANVRRAWIACAYSTAFAWILAVLWLVWTARLAAMVGR